MNKIGLIKTPQEIESMRQSGRILAAILQILKEQCKPGLTPIYMARIAKEELKRLGGQPAFLGFYDYPDIICISVNNEVQHSIPSDYKFKYGDIVNFDFGVSINGMITDAGISICVGGLKYAKSDDKRLLDGTQKALDEGIKKVKDGARVGDISNAIESTLKDYKLGIVRELVGHGVGYKLHEYPEVPNLGKSGTGAILKEGMTIAIEPITTLGSPRILEKSDGWTLITQDGSNSAQFEHTVLVTKNGCEILTKL